MFWYWFIFLLFVLLGLILFLNSRIELSVVRNGDANDYVSIIVVISHVITIKREFPMLRIVQHGKHFAVQWKSIIKVLSQKADEQDQEISFTEIKRMTERFQTLIKNLHNVRGKIKDIMQGFHMMKFRWNTVIGMDDAAIAAPFTGCVWTVKGVLLHHVFSVIALEAVPDISVVPDYKGNYYKTEFHCIFQFKVGYAIYAGLRLLYLYRKGVRHGRTSNSEFNDCCNG